MEHFKVFIEFMEISEQEKNRLGIEFPKHYEGEKAYQAIERLMEFEKNLSETTIELGYRKTYLSLDLGNIHEKKNRIDLLSNAFGGKETVADALEFHMTKGLENSLKKECIKNYATILEMDEESFRKMTEEKILFVREEMEKFREEEAILLEERKKKGVWKDLKKEIDLSSDVEVDPDNIGEDGSCIVDIKRGKYRGYSLSGKVKDGEYHEILVEDHALLYDSTRSIRLSPEDYDITEKEEKGGTKMASIREIVEEKLEKGKENGFKGLETTMSLEDMRKTTELGEIEFKEALTKALKNNEIFLIQPKEEKIGYDGSFKEVDKGHPKWMVSKEHFQASKKREEEFQKQHQERRKEGRETSYESKQQIVSSLSPDAQKAFETIHEMTEGKAYVLASEASKKAELSYPKWKEALEELKTEKVSFLVRIGKQVDGNVKEDWVVTNSKALRDKVIERENLKREMGILPKLEKGKEAEKEEKKEEEKPSKKKEKKESKEKKSKIPKKKKEKEEATR